MGCCPSTEANPEQTAEGVGQQAQPDATQSSSPHGEFTVEKEKIKHVDEPVVDVADELFYMANSLAYDKRYVEAVRAFGESIRLRPKFPKAFYQRGMARLHLHQIDEAWEDFKVALAYNYPLAHLGRAKALLAKNDTNHALGELAKVGYRCPSDNTKTPNIIELSKQQPFSRQVSDSF
jgi:tetratricopeptide (TPR) repeat protein